MAEKPLVSIITPSFNQGGFIEETIRSVLSQDYPALEYIVVDGGSTDNTVDILRKYGDRIQWVSEADRGQADAVNKGLGMARGEILGWLNSDDTYAPGSVSKAVEYFLANPEAVIVYGDAHFIDEEDRLTGRYPTEEFTLKRLGRTCFICQPALFMRRAVIREIGLLDEELQTCMDYEYWIRAGRHFHESRIAYIKGTYLANSRMYANNKTFGMREKVFREIMKTQKKYFSKVSKSCMYGYLKEIILGWRLK